MVSPLLFLFLSLLPVVSPFLFPSGNSPCCPPCAPPPVCTPEPVCAPPPTCAPPPPPPPAPCTPVCAPVVQNTACCASCGGCKNKARNKRNATTESPNREKRSLDEDVVKIDAKCNSDALRDIIVKNIDRVTAVAKRRIQTAAETQLGSRYNVICARGDFSYITNTEQFCQQTVGDVTCYVFKQLSDVVKKTM